MEKYPDLVVLGFPCNQFGKQEPGANATEILDGIRHVRPGNNFESKITQFFKKVEVNGFFQIDLYTYLKGSCEPTFSVFSESQHLFYEPLAVGDIAWNFEKFLIGRDGKPVQRYHPHVIEPDDIDMNLDIQKSLAAPNPFADEQAVLEQSPQAKSITFDDLLLSANKQSPTATKASLVGKIVVNEPLSP